MRFKPKSTQEGKEVIQMNQNFIPTDDQVLESVRGQMLHELVDEFSVDLLNSGTVGQAVALDELTIAISELSHMKSLEGIAKFMEERGYSIVNVIGMIIEAFRLPKDQGRAIQNAIAQV